MESGDSEESVFEKLKGIKIGDNALNVELDRKQNKTGPTKSQKSEGSENNKRSSLETEVNGTAESTEVEKVFEKNEEELKEKVVTELDLTATVTENRLVENDASPSSHEVSDFPLATEEPEKKPLLQQHQQESEKSDAKDDLNKKCVEQPSLKLVDLDEDRTPEKVPSQPQPEVKTENVATEEKKILENVEKKDESKEGTSASKNEKVTKLEVECQSQNNDSQKTEEVLCQNEE
jgi:hypothetical protein